MTKITDRDIEQAFLDGEPPLHIDGRLGMPFGTAEIRLRDRVRILQQRPRVHAPHRIRGFALCNMNGIPVRRITADLDMVSCRHCLRRLAERLRGEQ